LMSAMFKSSSVMPAQRWPADTSGGVTGSGWTWPRPQAC